MQYKQIAEAAIRSLSSTCANIVSYNNIPALYKAGGSIVVENKAYEHGDRAYHFQAIITAVVSDNYIVQESSTSLSNHFYNFLNSYGFSSSVLNQEANNNGIMSLYNVIIDFCKNNIYVYTSMYINDGRYICFRKTNGKDGLKNDYGTLIIQSIINNTYEEMLTNMYANLRVIPVKYTFLFSGG